MEQKFNLLTHISINSSPKIVALIFIRVWANNVSVLLTCDDLCVFDNTNHKRKGKEEKKEGKKKEKRRKGRKEKRKKDWWGGGPVQNCTLTGMISLERAR